MIPASDVWSLQWKHYRLAFGVAAIASLLAPRPGLAPDFRNLVVFAIALVFMSMPFGLHAWRSRRTMLVQIALRLAIVAIVVTSVFSLVSRRP
jgi:hypothetical protein